MGTPRPVSLQNQQRQASRREAKSGWHNWRVRYARDEKCKNSCILCIKPIASYSLNRDLPKAIWYTFEWSQEHYTMIRFLACVTFILGKYDKTSWRLLNICLIRNHIFSKLSISWFELNQVDPVCQPSRHFLISQKLNIILKWSYLKAENRNVNIYVIKKKLNIIWLIWQNWFNWQIYF